LINSGGWVEAPGPEDQLPDAWMPTAFFDYWLRPEDETPTGCQVAPPT
jgi:hypothetical protein